MYLAWLEHNEECIFSQFFSRYTSISSGFTLQTGRFIHPIVNLNRLVLVLGRITYFISNMAKASKWNVMWELESFLSLQFYKLRQPVHILTLLLLIRQYAITHFADNRKGVDITMCNKQRMYLCDPFRSNSICILLFEIGAALKN